MNKYVNGIDRDADVRSALFRDGSLDNGLIASVLIGGGRIVNNQLQTSANQNPQRSIRAALSRLGVSNTVAPYHHHHYHIYLRPPEAAEIISTNSTSNLLSDVPAPPVNSADAASIRPKLQENEMFVAALIGYLLPTPSVGIVGAVGLVEDAQNTVQQMMDRVETLTGYCRVVQAVLVGSPESKTRAEFQNFLLPAQPVLDYLYSNNQSALRPRPFITIIQQPQHGNLHRVPDHTDVNGTVFEDVYEYQPKPNYLGPDQFIALIEVSGRRVRMVWNLVAVEHVAEPPYLGESELSKLANDCESSQEIKRSVGGGQLDNNESVRYTGLGSATSGNPYTFNNISVTFASLEGQAVGNTAGVGLTAQITLDKDAAGHGWFIDTTPTTNEEFLPTADPTVWQARAGTAAAGKMDMLSVLLHEYGHALGLEHSGAASDFMSAALQPGVRTSQRGQRRINFRTTR